MSGAVTIEPVGYGFHGMTPDQAERARRADAAAARIRAAILPVLATCPGWAADDALWEPFAAVSDRVDACLSQWVASGVRTTELAQCGDEFVQAAHEVAETWRSPARRAA